MTGPYLTEAERAVLEALADGHWHNPWEIQHTGPAIGLHIQVIRSALRRLAVHRLAERARWGSELRFDCYRATGPGQAWIDDAGRQLRIV